MPYEAYLDYLPTTNLICSVFSCASQLYIKENLQLTKNLGFRAWNCSCVHGKNQSQKPNLCKQMFPQSAVPPLHPPCPHRESFQRFSEPCYHFQFVDLQLHKIENSLFLSIYTRQSPNKPTASSFAKPVRFPVTKSSSFSLPQHSVLTERNQSNLKLWFLWPSR